MRARVWIVATVMSVAAPVLPDDLVSVGSRVRVVGMARAVEGSGSLDGRLIGEVVATDGAVLTVRCEDGDAFALRWSEVHRLDVSRGRRSRGGGALRGAGRGALFGSALSLALLAAVSSGSGSELEAGAAAILAPAVGASVGLFMGMASPGERWARVEMGRARVQITPTVGPRGRGAGLAVSVGF